MHGAILAAFLIPVVLASSNEGNIHILEEDIATAIKTCTNDDITDNSNQRPKRSFYNHSPRIDDGSSQETNLYGHERRNTNDTTEKIHVLNATDYDYGGYGEGNKGEKFVNEVPRNATTRRAKRSEPLINKPDTNQCLSQCVFANLQVVDTRGIPREAELWSRVQSSVTSQQSRSVLRDQLRACFQELESEAEDDGCSYSNKLERCLMLQFDDRKTDLNTIKSLNTS